MENKYVRHAKIPEAKFRQLVRLFALDLTATQIAALSNLNRNTVNKYLKGIRNRIAEYCDMLAPPALQPIQKNVCKNRDPLLLGILECKGSIFTCPLQTEKAVQITEKLKNEKQIEEQIKDPPFSHFDVLVVPAGFRRIRLFDKRISRKAARTKSNRIEGFLGYTLTRLEKFKGLHVSTFLLHIKESEFRYNHSSDELYHLILKIIRKRPLF